jgi:hypothetical protein
MVLTGLYLILYVYSNNQSNWPAYKWINTDEKKKNAKIIGFVLFIVGLLLSVGLFMHHMRKSSSTTMNFGDSDEFDDEPTESDTSKLSFDYVFY